MPRVTRTIVPRIKKSLRERGIVTSLRRSFLLPFHLFREFRAAKSLRPHNYVAIDPERFRRALSSLGVAFEGFTFIDFGSGKGRALLLASEYRFKRIVGLEFSPELHRAAEENIRRYDSRTQQCRDIRSLNLDFANYALPPESSVLFFFHPCRTRVLSEVVAGIGRSFLSNPRPLYIVYVAPTQEQEHLFTSVGFLEKVFENAEFRFCLYQARP